MAVLQIEIKSPKQDNGLWGIPLSCAKIDKLVRLSDEDHLKHSAILIAIAEKFPNETFEIFWSREEGFYLHLSKSGMRSIMYKDYELQGNTLIWKR